MTYVIKHAKWFSCVLCLCTVIIYGCKQAEPPRQASAPAAEKPLFRLSVVPAISITATIEQYQPIADYLGRRLNIHVKLMPQKDYSSVLELLKKSEVDAGIMGSLLSYRAIREAGAVPLARPVINGSSKYEGLVFARKDSGITDIFGLKGKTFVYVDQNTSAGYVYPRYLLKKKGFQPEMFFGKVIFSGKHDAAIMMVLDKKADGGAAKDDVYFNLGKSNPRIKSELRVLHLSEARFPDRTIVARKDFDAGMAEKIKAILLNMNKDEEGRKILNAVGFDGFTTTEKADYNILEDMLR